MLVAVDDCACLERWLIVPPLPSRPAYTGLDWVSENIAKS